MYNAQGFEKTEHERWDNFHIVIMSLREFLFTSFIEDY